MLSERELQLPVYTDICYTLRGETEFDLNKPARTKIPFLLQFIDLSLLFIMLP